MPRHRRTTPPVLPASLALGVLGAATIAGGAAPVERPEPAAVAVSPVPDATLPTPVSARPRDAITDLGPWPGPSPGPSPGPWSGA